MTVVNRHVEKPKDKKRICHIYVNMCNKIYILMYITLDQITNQSIFYHKDFVEMLC